MVGCVVKARVVQRYCGGRSIKADTGRKELRYGQERAINLSTKGSLGWVAVMLIDGALLFAPSPGRCFARLFLKPLLGGSPYNDKRLYWRRLKQ